MKTTFHPKLQAKLSNLSEEQIEQILTTEVSAESVIERLKPIQKMLTNPNDTTIEGWVALDEFDFGDAFIHIEKPTLKSSAIADTGDYYGSWESHNKTYSIDRSLFPDLTYENSPKKVRITITPIES